MCAEESRGEGRDPIDDIILVSFFLRSELFLFSIKIFPHTLPHSYLPVISRSCLESNSIHEIRFSPGLISLSVNTSTTDETSGY